MEDQKDIYFSTTYDIEKAEHRDYCSVSFGYNAKALPILAALSILSCLLIPLLGSGFDLRSFFLSGFYFLCVSFGYLLTAFGIETGYKRNVLANGGKTHRNTVQFGSKIILSSEICAPVEFDYSQIRVIKQTKLFYLLGLGLNMHIIVPKDIAPCQTGTEFLPFIMERCVNLKKKKIQDYTHARTVSFVCVCIISAVMAINLLLMLL